MSRKPVNNASRNAYSDSVRTSSAATTLRRLTELFDLFERERVPLSSQQIAIALASPRSTVGTLLKSLTDLGWLSLDRRAATYFPTARVAHWGSWLLDGRWLDPRLIEATRALQRRTGETVSISVPTDLSAEVVFVAGQTGGIRLVIEVGQRLSVVNSAIGWAHCSTLPEATIRSLAHRALGEEAQPDGARARPTRSGRTTRAASAAATATAAGPNAVRSDAAAARLLLQRARAARRAGYAHADGAVIPDVAAWAAPLPRGISLRPLVLSVGGPSERITKHGAAVARALLDTIDSLARA
jgi:DNA-binding IclR family transcriptional regulator